MVLLHRLGKKPPRLDPRTLHFRKYFTPDLPVPPDGFALYQNVAVEWGMDLNDTEGDCTIAAGAHMILDWTANANPPPVSISDTDIQTAYDAVNGGVDEGADMLTVLNYWRKTGIGGHIIGAFVGLTLADKMELYQAIDLFGAAYIGVALPDAVVNPPDGDLLGVPWLVDADFIAANPPNPQNGHCIPILGWDEDGTLYCVTWGAVKPLSWEFYQAYCDEAFAVLSPDWLRTGESPTGFNLAQLQADLAALG